MLEQLGRTIALGCYGILQHSRRTKRCLASLVRLACRVVFDNTLAPERGTGATRFALFVLHIIVAAKIFRYQRKIEQSTKNIELGCISTSQNAIENRNLPKKDNQHINLRNVPKSMADLTTQILCLLLNLTFVAVHLAINRIEPKDLNAYEHRWLAYYIQIIGIDVAILGISVQYYVKNRGVPNAIWRNINGY